ERLFSEIRNLPDDGSKQQEGQEKCEHSPQPKEHSVDCDWPRMAGPVQQQGVAHTYRHAHEYVRGRRFKYYALVFHPWSSENRAVYTNISYPQAFAMRYSASGIGTDLVPVLFFPQRLQIPSQLLFAGIVARLVKFCSGQLVRQVFHIRKITLIVVSIAVIRAITQVLHQFGRRVS